MPPPASSRTISIVPSSTTYTESLGSPWRNSSSPAASVRCLRLVLLESGLGRQGDHPVGQRQQALVVGGDHQQPAGRGQLSRAARARPRPGCSRGGPSARRPGSAAGRWPAPGRSPPAAAGRPTAPTACGAPGRRGRPGRAARRRAAGRPRPSTPAPHSGTATLSSAERLGTRLNAWNTTPTSRRRYCEQPAGVEAGDVGALYPDRARRRPQDARPAPTAASSCRSRWRRAAARAGLRAR